MVGVSKKSSDGGFEARGKNGINAILRGVCNLEKIL